MRLQVQNINLDIISVGGLYTVVQLPNFKVAIDLGICPRSSFNKGHVFFTHVHADHISGVIRHCASRKLLGLTPPTYVIGAEDKDNFIAFMKAAGKLVRSDMEYTIQVVSPGDRVLINKQLCMRSYRSIHRAPCQGYVLNEIRNKLKPEYHGLPPSELQGLREAGFELTSEVETPLVTYTGDTTIEVFQREPILKQVKVLITEVTFFDDDVDKIESKRRGHMHIDDIIDNPDLFCQPAIVIMHASSRFSGDAVHKILQERVPIDLLNRIHVIPNDAPLDGF
jgi:ribonuclease Z